MEPTSEQELKQLLDEGRITEDEYKELLEALRQKETVQKPVEKPTKPKPKSKFGEAALVLFLLSIVIPVISVLLAFVLGAMGVKVFMAVPFIFLGLLCGLFALIFGIIGWKTPQGKIAAIGVPCLGLLILPGISLLGLLSGLRSTRSVKPLITHKTYSLNSLEGVLTQDSVEFDEDISSDGNGSLRIQTNSKDKTVIRLFETGPILDVNRILTYSAKVKSDLEDGKAYLEMWYDIPGKGEFFSRGIDQPITGKMNWTTLQTPFHVKYGSPFNIKLNIVIEGVGTVWIDDIKLQSSR